MTQTSPVTVAVELHNVFLVSFTLLVHLLQVPAVTVNNHMLHVPLTHIQTYLMLPGNIHITFLLATIFLPEYVGLLSANIFISANFRY